MKSIEERARECLKRAFMRTAANGHNFMTCSTEEARFLEEDIIAFAKEVQANDKILEVLNLRVQQDAKKIEELQNSLATLRAETFQEVNKMINSVEATYTYDGDNEQVTHALDVIRYDIAQALRGMKEDK